VLQRDDADYPAMLRRSPDPPGVLHVDGDAGLLWHPSIAIVGSRAATANGFDTARAFARNLAREGWCVVSGMAGGIDTAAHLGALDVEGHTIAVLGTGIDVPYPLRNTALMARIADHGAVVSEYPPGVGPQPWQFPLRNRIVAGLSLGTLVVEAQAKSGPPLPRDSPPTPGARSSPSPVRSTTRWRAAAIACSATAPSWWRPSMKSKPR